MTGYMRKEEVKMVRKLEAEVREKMHRQDLKQSLDCVKIKGVKNLSRSDLETILLYCDTIKKHGTWEGYLMQPLGGVGEVLAKYGL